MPNAKADAHLAAAAPDLLRACQLFIKWHGMDQESIETLNAYCDAVEAALDAINRARATGETP